MKKYPILEYILRNDFKVILFLLSVSFLISILSSLHWSTQWDESVYIGMGKYIFSSGTMGTFEVIRPIMLPVFLGLIWKTGLDPVLFGRIFISLIGLSLFYVTYRLFGNHIDKKILLLVLTFSFIVPLSVQYRTWILVHFLAALFCMISLYSYSRGKYFLAGLFAISAFLTRFPLGIFTLPATLILAYNIMMKENKKKHIKRLFVFYVGIVSIFIPVLIFNAISNVDEVDAFKSILHPILKSTDTQSNPFWSVDGYYKNLTFYTNVIINNGAIFLISLVSIFFVFRRNMPDIIRISIISFLLLFSYYTYVDIKVDRYFLDFLIFASISTSYLLGKLKPTRDHETLDKIISVMSIVLVVVHIFVLIGNFPQDRISHVTFQDYFSNISNKKIITVTPEFASYSDNLFIPIYDAAMVDIFERNKNADYFVYNKDYFFCTTQKCFDDVDYIYSQIKTKEIVAILDVYGKANLTVYKLK